MKKGIRERKMGRRKKLEEIKKWKGEKEKGREGRGKGESVK